ncbi:MAG: hypothetical protein MZV70_22590 [Desulfobacterales bacterium]|nr:hypothetical protein [Desulfobacterales bacterium]
MISGFTAAYATQNVAIWENILESHVGKHFPHPQHLGRDQGILLDPS